MVNEANQGAGRTERHARLILDSYSRLLGKSLLQINDYHGISLDEQLFESPTIVLSHGTEEDPVLNYGNRAAMRLWEMDWAVFTRTPSRLTAEPMERLEREKFLHQVSERGYVDNYTGIRISASGRRFYIKHAIVWNLTNEDGTVLGQAAAFDEFEYI